MRRHPNTVKKQVNRVKTLSNMVTEKLNEYYQDCKDYSEWQNENPDAYWYDKSFRTSPTEVKRLMLVLRQEMIKLGKML